MADESVHIFPDRSTKSHVNPELVRLCGDALPRYQHNPKQNVMHFTAMPHQLNFPLPAHGRTQSCAYACASMDGCGGDQEVLKSSLWPAQHTLSPAAGAGVSTTCPQHPCPRSRWGCAHLHLCEQQERGDCRALRLPGPVIAGDGGTSSEIKV